MTPASLPAFLKVLYNREPARHMVSLRGYDFDFKRILSCGTKELVPAAVEKILGLLKDDRPDI